MKFLIAYDVADDKRLRKVAKYFERYALRVQRSVFLFSGAPEQMELVMRGALAEIDPHEDVVQSWPIAATTSVGRFDQGIGYDPHGACLIVSAEEVILIGGRPCLDS
jgi:CRISPR-associated endonuclease Cas2